MSAQLLTHAAILKVMAQRYVSHVRDLASAIRDAQQAATPPRAGSYAAAYDEAATALAAIEDAVGNLSDCAAVLQATAMGENVTILGAA